MVHKTTRCGIRTGNSFKLGLMRARMRENARRQNLIRKLFQNKYRNSADSEWKNQRVRDLAASLVDDGDMDEQGEVRCRWGGWDTRQVEYSMNKRRRWLIPGIVEAAIDELRDLQKEQDGPLSAIRFVMIERMLPSFGYTEAIPRPLYCHGRCSRVMVMQNDCVGYHDSELEQVHVAPTQTYACASDLKAKGKQCKQKVDYEEQREKDKTRRRFATKRNRNRGVQRKAEGRCTRSADDNTNYWDDGDKKPEMRYEICYPQPLMAHKHYNDYTHQYRYNIRDYHTRKLKKAYKKCKSVFMKNCRDVQHIIETGLQIGDSLVDVGEHSSMRSDLEEDEEEEEDLQRTIRESLLLNHEVVDQLAEPSAKAKRPRLASFGDFIVTATEDVIWPRAVCPPKERRSHSNTASSEVCHIYPKGSFVIIDGEPATSSSPKPEADIDGWSSEVDDGSTSSSDWELVPNRPVPRTAVPCDVQPTSITQEYLHGNFGHRYIEGSCIPRRFAVKVLHQDSENIDGSGVYDVNILFEEQTAARLLVGLSGNISEEGVDMLLSNITLTLDDATKPLTVKDIVDLIESSTSQNIYTHTTESVLKKIREEKWPTHIGLTRSGMSNRAVNRRGPKGAFSLLHSLTATSVRSSTVHDAYQELVSASEVGVPSRETFSELGQHDLSKLPENCDICLEDIYNPYGLEDLDDPPVEATALATCQHWFCNCCWRHHIEQRISQSDLNITCPAYGCKAVVDKVTLLWLCPSYQLLRKHEDHVHQTLLDRNGQWKGCPNSTCGLVVKATTKKKGLNNSIPMCVECDCGQSWCLACGNEPHWPANCQQAASYAKLRRQKGGDGLLDPEAVYLVSVKRCPQCDHPIEKNGGCQHMSCSRCSFSFCWECLGEWAAHGSMLRCARGKVKETTMQIDRSMDVIPNEYFFELATSIRKLRRRGWANRTDRQRSIVTMARRTFQASGRYEAMLKDLSPVSLVGYEPLFGCGNEWKVLMDIESFKMQVWHIIEYSYVVLGNSSRRTRTKVLLAHIDTLLFIVDRMNLLLGNNGRSQAHRSFRSLVDLFCLAKHRSSQLLTTAAAMQRQIQERQARRNVEGHGTNHAIAKTTSGLV